MQANVTHIPLTCTKCGREIMAGRIVLTQTDPKGLIQEHVICPESRPERV